MEDGIATRKHKQGNDKAAEDGVKWHTDGLCQISRVLARRQSRYIVFIKNVHDHILQAFYKRKYLECIDLNKEETSDQVNKNATKKITLIQKGEVSYSNKAEQAEEKEMLSIINMGETMCKYKNAFQVQRFLEKCPFTAMKEGEAGISWQEIFILYKLCGGNDMLNKRISGAKKGPRCKNNFKLSINCAEGVINNGMEEID